MLITLPDLDRSIARSYVAETIEHPRYLTCHLGIWAVPGISREYVRLPDTGMPIPFASQREAAGAAREAAFHYLNEGNRSNAKRRNERMSGPEFAATLGELPISRADFAALWGCDTDKIWSWENGRDPVPFPFWWILPELADKTLISDALSIVNLHSQPKE